MTDKTTNPTPQGKKDPPARSPAKGGTAPLNTGGANQKPGSKVDEETQERLKKMLSDLRQAREKQEREPDKESESTPEKATKKESPAPPMSGPLGRLVKPASKSEATGSKDKAAPWPQPPQSLGAGSPPAPGGERDKPAAAPTRAEARTERLNRPPDEHKEGETPSQGTPRGSGLLARMESTAKPDSHSKGTTTVEMRRVPKSQIVPGEWKVIFQALAGSQIQTVGVEVKGLTVVGRSDAGSDVKPDVDLTPFAAREHGVSRQHVILFLGDEGPSMIDLNTTNGTWINGLYLVPGRTYRLRNGDRVELGSLKVLVRVVSPDEQGTSKLSGGAGSTGAASPKPKPS